ncbi:MAG: hypothetical protein SFY95_12850 [Planctomycetota bacterium]|nr:hypothetical protein [Planctomycetota bacterium]
MTKLALTVALAGLATTALAQVGPNAFYSANVRGDFAAGGWSTRGNAASNVNLAGVGGGVVRAFAVWNFLSNNALGAAGENSIIINGNAVNAFMGATGAPDLCWGFNGVNTYVADVTGIVLGNGVYNVNGAQDGAGRLGEGVSIVAVWDNGTGPTRTVDLFHGIANNVPTSGFALSTINFSGVYGGGPAHFLANALDGQFAGDEFVINNSGPLGGIYPGTGAPGDAAQGALGGLYDHFDGDASPYMNLGDTSMRFGTTLPFGDCVGHTLAAISYIPTPGAIALLGIGGIVAGRRRRN